MTLTFGEVGERQDVADGRYKHSMIRQEGLFAVNGTTRDEVGHTMAFFKEFVVLSCHILVHCNVEPKHLV